MTGFISGKPALKRFFKALTSPQALIGWAIAFSPKVWRIIEVAGDMDFIAQNADKIGGFLQTGTGTLFTVFIGIMLVGHAAYKNVSESQEPLPTETPITQLISRPPKPITLTFVKGAYQPRIIKDGAVMLSAKIRFHFSADNVDVFLDLKGTSCKGGFRRFKVGNLLSVYDNQETVFELIKARKTDAQHYHEFVDKNGQKYDSYFINQSSISTADEWPFATTLEYDARVVLAYHGKEDFEYFKIFPSRRMEAENSDKARSYIPNVKTRDDIKQEFQNINSSMNW